MVIVIRYIRVYPQAWHGHLSMRAGVLVCRKEQTFTRNYDKVGDNYCVSATRVDLQQTNHPDGDTSREACGSDCDKHAPQCSAIEWYNGGWEGSKCKLLLDTRKATQAKEGERWKDAECWVRKEAVQSQGNHRI